MGLLSEKKHEYKRIAVPSSSYPFGGGLLREYKHQTLLAQVIGASPNQMK